MKLPRYMIATKASHITGDISRDIPDLCFVHREEGDNYIGNWSAGYGLVEVRFPKATTRDLTEEEVEYYKKMVWVLNGNIVRPALEPSYAAGASA